MNKPVIVVTGASSGIGRALAVAAARDGFAVLLVARRPERLTAAAVAIRAEGGTCETLVADVIAREAPERIVDAAVGAFGRIDVLVNNAGSGVSGPLLAQSDAAIERQWQLHVGAPLRIARAALPHIERSGGQLVFVGSGIVRVPMPNYGAYGPAKAAIRAAATQMRRELRARGVSVTYVDPGLVDTEFHGSAGMQRSSRIKAATPQRVARAMLRGIARRAPMVAAVPWQTAGSIALEWLGPLADALIVTMSDRPVDATVPAPLQSADLNAPPAVAEVAPTAESGNDAIQRSNVESALEAISRRLARVNLPVAFLESILVPDATLELNEVAMRWAGMPNKNERAALREAFDALCAAGYLAPAGGERFTVVRGANETTRT